jgi:hypothetical protein
MSNVVFIEGTASAALPVSPIGAETEPLEAGVYDCYCDVDVFIKVDEEARDVTILTGYRIFAGNAVPFRVNDGRRIGAIAGAAGTLRFQKVG